MSWVGLGWVGSRSYLGERRHAFEVLSFHVAVSDYIHLSYTAVQYLSIYPYASSLVRLIIFTIHATTSHLHSFYFRIAIAIYWFSVTHGILHRVHVRPLQSQSDAAPFF